MGKLAIKTSQLNVRVDGLTLTSTLLVLNGRRSRFKSVTIPVDGIEVDKLSPGPFLWFRLRENFFKKVVLININLGTPSYCKKIRSRRSNQDSDRVLREIKKVYIHYVTGIYTRRIQYSPSFVNWHIVRLPWVTHPTVAF